MFSFNGQVKIVDRPHKGKNELPKTVRASGRSNKRFNVLNVLSPSESPFVSLFDRSMSES